MLSTTRGGRIGIYSPVGVEVHHRGLPVGEGGCEGGRASLHCSQEYYRICLWSQRRYGLRFNTRTRSRYTVMPPAAELRRSHGWRETRASLALILPQKNNNALCSRHLRSRSPSRRFERNFTAQIHKTNHTKPVIRAKGQRRCECAAVPAVPVPELPNLRAKGTIDLTCAGAMTECWKKNNPTADKKDVKAILRLRDFSRRFACQQNAKVDRARESKRKIWNLELRVYFEVLRNTGTVYCRSLRTCFVPGTPYVFRGCTSRSGGDCPQKNGMTNTHTHSHFCNDVGVVWRQKVEPLHRPIKTEISTGAHAVKSARTRNL